MLGPIGSNLIGILKVLTPSEIERYSKEGVVGEVRQISRKALAAGAEFLDSDPNLNPSPRSRPQARAKDEDKNAKILPFNRDDKASSEHPPEDPYASKPQNYANNDKEETEAEAVKSASTNPSSQETVSLNHVEVANEGLESLGILSSKKLKDQQIEQNRIANSKQDSSSVFLIKQRKKLSESQSKLVEQSAISNYKKTLQEIKKSQLKVDDSDEAEEFNDDFSGSSGVLLNKKTY